MVIVSPGIADDGAASRGSPKPKYVLQIKLQPHERAAVVAAAKASFLATATWARQIVLRHAGVGAGPGIDEGPPLAIAVPADAARSPRRSRRKRRPGAPRKGG